MRPLLALLGGLALAAPAHAATLHVAYGSDEAGPLRADVYRPAHHARAAVIVVHGGSWLYNTRAVIAPEARQLAAQSGFVVMNIEYPHSPPGPVLQERQVAAVADAVGWLREHAQRLAVDPRRIGAVGSSAGGNLVGLLATTGRGSLRSGTRLGAAVAWSGQLDLEALTGEGATNVTRYLGCDLAACPQSWALASPIDHVNHGDTPMLLFGSREDSTPPSQATLMARALRHAGVDGRAVVLPGSRHGQQYAAVAMARTIAFLRTHLARGG